MSLRSLMRRHAAQLLTTTVQVEVQTRDYVKSTGFVNTGVATIYTVVASELGGYRKRYRDDSTAPIVEAFIYVPVPSSGLPFTPERGQVVIVDDARWVVVEIRPQRVTGAVVGFRLDLSRGGA